MLRGRPWRQGLPRFLFCLLLAAGATASAAPPPAAIEGVASLRGELTAGVVVFAFAAPGPGPEAQPLAASEPTGKDGIFRLAVSPGQYHLVAARKAGGGWAGRLAPGDLFSYHLGNPVAAEAGRAARVGFNLVRVPAERPPSPGGAAGIGGRITFADRPLPRAYLYVYRDPALAFRGLGESVVPADERGEFRLRLAPGRYWVIARKRQAGGMYGPPGKDDHVGYYPGNPVTVRGGETLDLTIETTTRLDQLEELFAPAAAAGWFSGRVVDAAGAPVGGLYVLLYPPGREDGGAPARVAGPTDRDGRFRAPADGRRYRVVARANLGGPPEAGEWYGAWRGPRGEPELSAVAGRTVTLRVERHRP